MTIKTTSHCKPNLLVLLACFVATSVLATGLAQAAQRDQSIDPDHRGRDAAGGEKWWQSVWGLDLAGKLREWHPKITLQNDAEGFNLARPFSKSGPTIQCSSSLPDSVRHSLRASGGHQVSTLGSDTDVFVFLQKRW
jgi:hypothetical protein